MRIHFNPADVILLSLLLVLNRFHKLFCCFHFSICTSRWWLGMTKTLLSILKTFFYKLTYINCLMEVDETQCVESVQIQRFFCSVFPRIQTEYGEIQSISPYSARMRGNTDQKKTPYLDTYHAVTIS